MWVAYMLTRHIESLWALLGTRVVIAAVLYYVVMKVARVKILGECERFVKGKLKR